MNKVSKFDPFTQLTGLQKQFFGEGSVSPFRGIDLPTTDVYTKNNKLIVEAHLPNFLEKDVNVQIDGDALIINAEKHEKEEDMTKNYVSRESSSSFYRRISLPERADAAKIDAKLEEGILTVTVPLKKLSAPKKVLITSPKKK